MSSTAYERGRQFEYRVANYLRELGYVVTRSPKSKSPVDLFVIGHSLVLFIQCKRHGVLGPKGWNALIETCDKCCAVPVMVANEARRLAFYHLMAPKTARGPQPRIKFVPMRNVVPEKDLAMAG